MRRYSPRRRKTEILKRLFDWKKIAIGAAVFIAAVVVIVLVSGSKSVEPGDTPYAKEDRMTVGVATDTAFGYEGEDGSVNGYEAEVLRQMIRGLYGEEMKIEFHPLNAQQVSYLLKNDVIDCAAGMLPENVTKTRGLLLSDPYYLDQVECYVRPGSAAGIESLKGKTIGVITTMIAKSRIQNELKEVGFTSEEIDLLACTSYPDAWEDLRAGRISALIVPRYKVGSEQRAEFEELDTGDVFEKVGYRVALWTDDGNLKKLINQWLEDEQNQKILQKLEEKWGLTRN